MEKDGSSSLVSRVVLWLGSCLLALVLYVASVGPLVLVIKDGPHPILEIVYAPLEWAAQKEVIGPPFQAYVEWWRKLLHD